MQQGLAAVSCLHTSYATFLSARGPIPLQGFVEAVVNTTRCWKQISGGFLKEMSHCRWWIGRGFLGGGSGVVSCTTTAMWLIIRA